MPEFINVDFKPSLRQVRQDFAHLEDNLEDKVEVFGAALAVAQNEIREMFDEEHDAMGQTWQYWKDSPPGRNYARRAEGLPNIGILNRRGRASGLRARATSSQAFTIVGNTLSYGRGLPEWAGVHLHGGVRVRGGYKIPQRSFYPYSAAGVTAVKRIFDEWATKAIAIIPRTSSRGRTYTQVQRREPTGRFGGSAF